MTSIFSTLPVFSWTFIFAALQMRGPMTIARFIVTVIVDAINNFPPRSFTHVGKKVFKREPSFANFNSSTTVISVPSSLFVCAANDHVGPALIRPWVCPLFRGMAYCKSILGLPASARLRTASSQLNDSNNGLLAAVALAKPQRAKTITASSFKSNKPTKPLSCDINESGHRGLLTGYGVKWQGSAEPLSCCAYDSME
jgi:hypothetical protein